MQDLKTFKGYPVLRMRERAESGDYVILVDRGEDAHQRNRYVTGRINDHSLQFAEWYWGHYFESLDEALEDFYAR